MIALEETAAVLLCAGLSRRYRDGNKLLAKLDGKPLLAHAADLLRSLPFARRIAVIGGDEIAALLDGFEHVRNPEPERGQDSSVRLGIAAADGRAVLICLGDMPLVTPAHLMALAEAAGPERASISHNGQSRLPPTLLPASICRAILEADEPVREVLGRMPVIEVRAPPEMLRDFDTIEDFPTPAHPE